MRLEKTVEINGRSVRLFAEAETADAVLDLIQRAEAEARARRAGPVPHCGYVKPLSEEDAALSLKAYVASAVVAERMACAAEAEKFMDAWLGCGDHVHATDNRTVEAIAKAIRGR